MAGISSRALKSQYAENRKGYNGNELQSEEFTDGSGLEFYDFEARSYDQQIARFIQIDPKLEEDGQEPISPYHFSYNNPIRFNDPDGEAPSDIVIRGENNSSVTIKTDLIDIDINASSLGVDFGGAYEFAGDDLLSAALDIVGIFDPTGIADALGAKMAADKGDWWSFGISSLAIIPWVGDIGKIGKIGKDVQIIKDAVKAVDKAKDAKKISKPSDIVTAAGGKVDPKTGQKIGPSGKPSVHTVKHATQKRAKDAARQGGRGTPVKHTKDRKGGRHYHSGSGKKGKGKGTKKYGSKAGKVSNNVHHEY